MSNSALGEAKALASDPPKKVPTACYRVLAGAFALIAVLGLFLGYLGNFVSLFAHSGAILDPNLDLALTDGIWLKGSLFGYIACVLKFYLFDSGFTASFVALEILDLAIVIFLTLAVLSSVTFFIVALCTKGGVPRNLATASGILVALAYAFPLVLGMLTAPTYHVEGGSVGYEFPGFTLYYDLPLLLIAGLTTAVLFITAVCRRKWIGAINVLLAVLTFAVAYVLIRPESPTYANVLGLFDGTLENLFVRIVYGFVVCFFTLNLVLCICRLNAKRAYGLDVARYALAISAALCVVICCMFQNSDDMWAIVTETPLFTVILLAVTTAAFFLSIVNLILVIVRRKKAKKKRAVPTAKVEASHTSHSIEPVIVLQMPQVASLYPEAAPAPIPVPDVNNLKAFEQQMKDLAEGAPVSETTQETHIYPLPILPRVMPAAEAHPDKFLESLTLEEQGEFFDLFISKIHGDYHLPEYKTGGDNALFFKKVFAALGKYRDLISDSLLEKMYHEAQ